MLLYCTLLDHRAINFTPRKKGTTKEEKINAFRMKYKNELYGSKLKLSIQLNLKMSPASNDEDNVLTKAHTAWICIHDLLSKR